MGWAGNLWVVHIENIEQIACSERNLAFGYQGLLCNELLNLITRWCVCLLELEDVTHGLPLAAGVSWHRWHAGTTTKPRMKCRVNLFPLLCGPGDPQSSSWAEAHKRGCRHHGARSVLDYQQICCFHPFIEGLCRRSSAPCFGPSHAGQESQVCSIGCLHHRPKHRCSTCPMHKAKQQIVR